MSGNSMKQTLSKKDIENIKAYENEIKTIELFVDSVRKTPGQYLSSIGNEGFMNCIREVFQNSADEMARKESMCNKVWVTFYEANHRVVIADNGRAISPHIMIRVFTREHTSTNFTKKAGEYPSGLHGVGAKCVNAVSSRFTVTSYYLGKAYQIEFSEGKPLQKYNMKPKEIPNKNGLQGLVVDFEPDYKIMKTITITCEDVLNLLCNLVPLYAIGAEVEFTGYKLDGTVIHEDLVNRDGLMEFLVKKTDKPLIKPIMYGYDNGTMKVNVAMTWEANINMTPDIITFANTSPVNTNLSTPSKGFIDGVTSFFVNYMNKIYLANSKKNMKVIGSDVLTGIKAVISAAHMDVMFSGQAKNVCKNEDLVPFVKKVTIDTLNKWMKSNPDDLQKLAQFIKDCATVRYRADKEKITISKKYKNTLLGLPKGFTKAENKNHLELFIVEGLSASSPCELGRVSEFQAIFPIRGKLPNVFNCTKEKFLKNEEVAGILAILGAGYGKNFDIDKCPYDKVCILSDMDVDGYHIATLIIKFLAVYCRPLIEAGRVYRCLSPLYHVDKGKKSWKYFIDKNDFIHYVRDEFIKKFEIKHYKTKEKFSKQQIQNLIITNDRYDDILDPIATTYAIDPVLLEDLIILRNQPYKKFKSMLEGKYRYLKVNMVNNAIVLDGMVNDLQQTIVLTDEFRSTWTVLFPFIDRSEKRYLMNGKKVGLYEIIKQFRASEPKNIERSKGLGGMNAKEIGISTLDPNNRILLRYTTEDIDREIEEMRRVNDDKYSLIKDIDISQYEF